MHRLRMLYRLTVALTCGAMLLQAGGCALGDVLLPSLVNITLSTLLSLLFGVPVL